jgi:hypothetical protein
VRIFIEPEQYRNPDFPEYWLTASRVDQLWRAGAQIKQRTHQGLTHMKVLITSTVAMLGSSNFTKNWERDHNYFIQAAAKPQLHAELVNRFAQMWADTANYTAFQPKPPRVPTLVAPSNGATNVLVPTVNWTRAPWAVAFDVYFGTSPATLQFAGRTAGRGSAHEVLVHATRRTPPSHAVLLARRLADVCDRCQPGTHCRVADMVVYNGGHGVDAAQSARDPVDRLRVIRVIRVIRGSHRVMLPSAPPAAAALERNALHVPKRKRLEELRHDARARGVLEA